MKYLKFYETFTFEELNDLIIKGKTYVKKFSDYVPSVQNEIREKIKNYNFDNFSIEGKYYSMEIIPDNNFVELLNKYNETLDKKFDINLNIFLSVDINRANLIDFDESFALPIQLRGLKIGYKLYKLIIKNFGYITSDVDCSTNVKGIWYNLMMDKDLYAFTSEQLSGVILKTIKNDNLKNILDNLKKVSCKKYEIEFKDINFDKELQEKIIEIYGN